MILQALDAYYQRLAGDPSENVPRQGYSREKIHFALVLGQDGTLLDVHDLRIQDGKKLVPKELFVPHPGKKRAGTNPPPNFLWDNTGYVLGADAKGKPDHTQKCFLAFRKQVLTIPDDGDAGLTAVRAFLSAWQPERASEVISAFLPWDDVAGKNLVFRLDGEQGYIHERSAARAAWSARYSSATDATQGFCLVSGTLAPIAQLHPAIKGVPGAQTAGASLVSFNLDAFESYGKKQNHNAPVSVSAAFGYTTALNHLLRAGSNRRVQIGDATTVFWSERPSVLENLLGLFLDDGQAADDGGLAQVVRRVLEAAREGRMPPELGDTDVPFYVLGLAPNAARLSVRFFEVSTTGKIAARVGSHFRDIQTERRHPRDPEFPSMWQLLIELAPLRKSDNIPPTLSGTLMRAILGGHSYPRSLLAAIIGRIRADHEVSYLRAALLKGYFTRAPKGDNTWEVGVTLDPASTDIGYRLGRLFAILEKAQQDALPGIKATIRDRFYGAASATPRAVFPRLIHLAQFHISKADYGYISDKRLGEVMEGLNDFPAHLTMDQQGRFALGYYHQRNAPWRKADTTAQAPVPADD